MDRLTMTWEPSSDDLVVHDEHPDELMRVRFRASWSNDQKRRFVSGIVAAFDVIADPIRHIDVKDPYPLAADWKEAALSAHRCINTLDTKIKELEQQLADAYEKDAADRGLG